MRRALPWPPNKHFYEEDVSQSRYTNLIDGHASLKRSQSAKAERFSRAIVNNISEVYTWLKSLPGGLGLEKCSRVLESRGFVTLSSLKQLRPGDIDAFLLAEKHVLESEIKGMIDPESRIISLWPQELFFQRFFFLPNGAMKSVIAAEHFTHNNSCLQHCGAFNCWRSGD